MQFASKDQQGFMFAKHPKFAKKEAKHTSGIKNLSHHVSEDAVMQDSWEHPGCEDKVGKMFVVLKPSPEALPKDIVHQTHAFGMGQYEPQDVHGVYTDRDEADLVAEAVCAELYKHLSEVEKKKDHVVSEIEKHIARLQKEINSHMKEATHSPELAEGHHQLAEKKMGIIRNLRDKHKTVKSAKKELPKKDKE